MAEDKLFVSFEYTTIAEFKRTSKCRYFITITPHRPAKLYPTIGKLQYTVQQLVFPLTVYKVDTLLGCSA